jgi:hypothetical protein
VQPAVSRELDTKIFVLAGNICIENIWRAKIGSQAFSAILAMTPDLPVSSHHPKILFLG